jgi:hypothetical protein
VTLFVSAPGNGFTIEMISPRCDDISDVAATLDIVYLSLSSSSV